MSHEQRGPTEDCANMSSLKRAMADSFDSSADPAVTASCAEPRRVAHTRGVSALMGAIRFCSSSPGRIPIESCSASMPLELAPGPWPGCEPLCTSGARDLVGPLGLTESVLPVPGVIDDLVSGLVTAPRYLIFGRLPPGHARRLGILRAYVLSRSPRPPHPNGASGNAGAPNDRNFFRSAQATERL